MQGCSDREALIFLKIVLKNGIVSGCRNKTVLYILDFSELYNLVNKILNCIIENRGKYEKIVSSKRQ